MHVLAARQVVPCNPTKCESAAGIAVNVIAAEEARDRVQVVLQEREEGEACTDPFPFPVKTRRSVRALGTVEQETFE